jgi:D-alanyl-D-alanine carboxypeptidase (penicillin-binding protein 5/6)
MSRRDRRQSARARRPWRVLLIVVVVVVVMAAVFVGVRLSAAAPPAVVTSALGHPRPMAAPTVPLPWPSPGQSAVAVPSIGMVATSGPETAAPIASLVKLMTAYVILRDHPLKPGQPGPNITITQADLDDYNADATNDEANAQVTVGEVLTESQVLGGLLVHSADNYTDTVARWDAGSVPAFVDKMNRTAAQLGMDHTHYTDTNGSDQGGISTASDQLKVAAPDMANPVFASFVQRSSITLPVAGTIATYTPLLGVEGVIGVKSGYTTVAGGCDVLAVERRVHGLPILVLAAVTGQTGANAIFQAGLKALNLSNSVVASIGTSQMISAGQVVAHVEADGRTVDATASSSAGVLSWPGLTPRHVLVSTKPVADGARRGTRIGTVVVTLGAQRVLVPVTLRQDLPKESLAQRVF